MYNLISFLNSFLSYLLVFAIVAVLVVIASFVGIKLRKNKDAKDALAMMEESTDTTKVK